MMLPPIVRQKVTQMFGADERSLVADPGVDQGATVDEMNLVTNPGGATIDERSFVADSGVDQGATVDERSLVVSPGVDQGGQDRHVTQRHSHGGGSSDRSRSRSPICRNPRRSWADIMSGGVGAIYPVTRKAGDSFERHYCYPGQVLHEDPEEPNTEGTGET